MADSFVCYACHKVSMLIGKAEKKCPSCGSTNGELRSAAEIKEGMEAGVYFNIDPNTGKRAKKKHR